jgi:hypothetical protein
MGYAGPDHRDPNSSCLPAAQWGLIWRVERMGSPLRAEEQSRRVGDRELKVRAPINDRAGESDWHAPDLWIIAHRRA